MNFKLDENISPLLSSILEFHGHDVHTVAQEALGGAPDTRIIEVCRDENRALVSLNLDFSNIVAYPPAHHLGIIVLRLSSQAYAHIEKALLRIAALMPHEQLSGRLWIVEDDRVRIHGSHIID